MERMLAPIFNLEGVAALRAAMRTRRRMMQGAMALRQAVEGRSSTKGREMQEAVIILFKTTYPCMATLLLIHFSNPSITFQLPRRAPSRLILNSSLKRKCPPGSSRHKNRCLIQAPHQMLTGRTPKAWGNCSSLRYPTGGCLLWLRFLCKGQAEAQICLTCLRWSGQIRVLG